MRKLLKGLLVLLLIFLAFIGGFLIGTIRTSQRQEERKEYQSLGRTLQELQILGFLTENRSMAEDKAGWVTTRNFAYFIEAARINNIDTLYYAFNEWAKPYFWFFQPGSSLCWRYDLG